MKRWAWSLALFGAASGAYGQDVSKSFDAAAIKSLRLENGRGEVHIRAASGPHAGVAAHKVHFDDSCHLSIEVAGDTLEVSNKESPGHFGRDCEVNFDLELPRSLKARVVVGSGNVDVTGVGGSLEYLLGSGNLSVRDATLTSLGGRSGSGNVTFNGATDDLDLKLGAGDAQITLTRPVSKGRMDVKMGTGSVVVSLPGASKVRGTFKAGVGSMTNEFPAAKGPAFQIDAMAGTGDLTIRRI